MEDYVQCSHCGVRNPVDVRSPYAIAECVNCGCVLPLLQRPSAEQPPDSAPGERVGIEQIGDELVLDMGEIDSGTGEEAMKPPAAAASEDEMQPLTSDAVNAMFDSMEYKGKAAAPPADETELPTRHAVDAIINAAADAPPAPPEPEPAPAPPAEAAATPRRDRDEVGAIFDAWESKADAPALQPAQEPEIPKLEAVTASAAPARLEPLVVAACIAISLIGGLVAVSFFTTGPQEPIVTPQAFGRLELEIAPRPSEVLVGATKFDLESGGLKLPAGAHKVEARFDDLASIVRQVDITSGKTARLSISAYREIGTELEKRGKRDEARRSFEEALARAGDDAERKELREAVTRLAPDAGLSVTSEPAGAEVLLDGQPAGRTPLALKKVEPGSRKIEVRSDGYAPEMREVVAEAGKTQEVNVALKLLTGTVRVAGLLAGDRVKVETQLGAVAREVEARADGKIEVDGLKPGGYRVLVERASHDPGRVQVVVESGRVAEVVDPRVVDRRGTLTVEVHPEGSMIDGAVKGVTRTRGLLEAGVHKLRARHPEAGETERVATVKRGEETVETIDLWELRGVVHFQARRLEEAEQAFGRARPLARGRGIEGVANAWLDRAGEQQIAGEARKAAEHALRLMPADARIKTQANGFVHAEAMARGSDHAKKGDWAAARAAADEALKIRPGDAAATALIAECSFRAALARAEKAAAAGDLKEARLASAEALVLRPDDARAKELAALADPPKPDPAALVKASLDRAAALIREATPLYVAVADGVESGVTEKAEIEALLEKVEQVRRKLGESRRLYAEVKSAAPDPAMIEGRIIKIDGLLETMTTCKEKLKSDK